MISFNNRYLNIAAILFLSFLLHSQYKRQDTLVNPEIQKDFTCQMDKVGEGKEHIAAADHKISVDDLVVKPETPLLKRMMIHVLRMGIDPKTLKEIDEIAAKGPTYPKVK